MRRMEMQWFARINEKIAAKCVARCDPFALLPQIAEYTVFEWIHVWRLPNLLGIYKTMSSMDNVIYLSVYGSTQLSEYGQTYAERIFRGNLHINIVQVGDAALLNVGQNGLLGHLHRIAATFGHFSPFAIQYAVHHLPRSADLTLAVDALVRVGIFVGCVRVLLSIAVGWEICEVFAPQLDDAFVDQQLCFVRRECGWEA